MFPEISMAQDGKVGVLKGAILELLLLNSNPFEVDLTSNIFNESYVTQKDGAWGLELKFSWSSETYFRLKAEALINNEKSLQIKKHSLP